VVPHQEWKPTVYYLCVVCTPSSAAAASELGLYATQIYQLRAKAAHEKSVTDGERQLREQNARLKRQLAGKTGEVTILKNSGVLY